MSVFYVYLWTLSLAVVVRWTKLRHRHVRCKQHCVCELTAIVDDDLSPEILSHRAWTACGFLSRGVMYSTAFNVYLPIVDRPIVKSLTVFLVSW